MGTRTENFRQVGVESVQGCCALIAKKMLRQRRGYLAHRRFDVRFLPDISSAVAFGHDWKALRWRYTVPRLW
jgi:hypothetical protein